ncbi:MAG: hypothetical protein JNM38_23950 [Acidobacteria bacterium]|nr:hypothetical protein [Acidobacteriota bacterium]
MTHTLPLPRPIASPRAAAPVPAPRHRTWHLARAAVAAALCAGVLTAIQPPAGAQSAAPSRVFVTFVSHNDESFSNEPCRWVGSDRARYITNRAAIVEAAQRILEAGATWDVQSDWEYLTRVQQWDDEQARGATDGKNIVRWLAEIAPARIVVDAHSHERSGYNYADVAALVQALGAPDTGIVGGFIYTPARSETWTKFRAPLTGKRFPSFAWQPQAIWGGASRNHVNDSNASGIWRPASATAFHTDDPAQRLVNIGNATGGILAIDGTIDLLDRLGAGQLPPGRMYTSTIMIPQCELDNDPAVLASVASITQTLAPYVARGDLAWATLPEMLRIWRDEYQSRPNVFLP